MSKKVAIELIGLARRHAGQDAVSVSVQEGATWRDVIAAMGQVSPALVGNVVSEDGRTLLGSYVLNLGGTRSIYDLDAEATLEAAARLSLLDVGIC